MPPSTRSAKRQTGPTSAPSAGWATFGAVVVACAAVAVSSSWTVLSGGGPLTGAAFLAPLLVTARKCFTLSYSVAPCAPGAEQLYGKGPDDVWLVLTAFTFLLAVQWAFFRWAVVPARWLIQRLAVRTASGAPSSKRAQSPASNRRRVASLQRAGAAPSASVMSGDGAADRFQSADGLNQG